MQTFFFKNKILYSLFENLLQVQILNWILSKKQRYFKKLKTASAHIFETSTSL